MRFFILLFSLMFLLTGCATPYQPAGLGGGYSEMALSQDTYQVSFRGNGYSSNEHVQRYLIRRCAEITLQRGYRFFAILNGNVSANHSVWTTPATVQSSSFGNFNGYINNMGYGNYSASGSTIKNTYTTISPAQTNVITRYTDSVIIKFLNSNKLYPYALDAAVILSNFNQTN